MVPDMSTKRSRHAAVLLSSNKVLITGDGRLLIARGFDQNHNYLSACETYDSRLNQWIEVADIYDITSNTSTYISNISIARYQHTATLLRSGNVLDIGDSNNGDYLETCELYDPPVNQWSTVASIFSSHVFHTPSLLPSGKVLVVGRSNSTLGEIYDPSSDTWVPALDLLLES